jgi:microcompartment protein CcmL/EutN
MNKENKMAKVALGFVETRGNTGCILAIDAMLKTASVDLVKKVEIGGGYVTAIVRGEVGAVKSSIEAGAEAAAKVGELLCANVIPSAHNDVFDLISVKK